MELEDLDNINKNDFLPLLPLNIKQELLDNNGSIIAPTGGGEMGVGGGNNSAGGIADGASGSGGAEASGSGNGESANICDSVEKQVSST